MILSRIGPIALEEPLGGAADSNVVRGVHVERNLAMAVKLLPRGLVNRPMGGDTFAADVKRLQKLVHPHIARYYGGAMDNGQPYLALELVEGESLRSVLDRRGRLAWETTADLAEAICEALHYAHGASAVHQRLTPARVMLPPGGGVKLLGFDCALVDHDDVLGLRSPMGVANYLAPEVFRGKQSAALPSSDMFSLGVIMYECLTGELPWKATTPADLVQARRDGPAPRVSAQVLECPVWLDVLVARLLETKRGVRLATADATRRAIVDAKRKVAEGMGAAQQAWSGRQGALTVDRDRKEIGELRRRQLAQSHVRDESPFYERAWFLALALAAVASLVVWLMWPKNQLQMFAEIQSKMESERAGDWYDAEEEIEEFRRRFPDSSYADDLAAYEEKIAMNHAIEEVKNLDRFGRKPSSEAQKYYAEAWRRERFGDLMTAWRGYEQAISKVPPDAPLEVRAYATLARQGIARIKSAPAEQRDVVEAVRGKLQEARALMAEGKKLPARVVLDDLIAMYEGRAEVRDLVAEARAEMAKLDSP
ncbi:MAG: serine/threonine protein kinase [Pirellulales bacterium]|nr:serine/threonine protein kinase [Pirellulales bacterium]